MIKSLFSVVLLVTFTSVTFGQEASLIKELAGLEPLIGKSFRGEMKDSKPDKPIVDVSTWERALNGKAVRMLHSINDGQYGGETMFMWDAEQKKVVYWYFTTAGFTTKGTIEFDKNKFTSLEEVKGNAQGITKVRATSTLNDDGSLHVKSEYLAGDNWTPGHEVTYKPAKDAKVIFQ